MDDADDADGDDEDEEDAAIITGIFSAKKVGFGGMDLAGEAGAAAAAATPPPTLFIGD